MKLNENTNGERTVRCDIRFLFGCVCLVKHENEMEMCVCVGLDGMIVETAGTF